MRQSWFVVVLALSGQVHAQSSEANVALVKAFYAEPQFNAWKEAVFAWGPVMSSEIRTGYRGVSTPERLAEHYKLLAELDATCKAKYAGMKDPSKYASMEVRPATWCEIATKRDDIAKTLVAENTKALVDAELKAADALLAPEVKTIHVVAGSWYKDLYAPNSGSVKGIALSSKHMSIMVDGGASKVADVRAQIAAWTKPAGLAEDPATTQQLDELGKKLTGVKAAVDAALPAPVFIAKAKDAKAEAAGKAGIDGKILKSGMMKSSWVVTVNSNNKPVDRVKIGTIFYKKGDYCVYRSFSYKEYAKAGKFSGGGKVADYADWLMRCK